MLLVIFLLCGTCGGFFGVHSYEYRKEPTMKNLRGLIGWGVALLSNVAFAIIAQNCYLI